MPVRRVLNISFARHNMSNNRLRREKHVQTAVSIESKNPETEAFLRSLRTDGTRMTYDTAFRLALDGRADSFLALARADKKKAENLLLEWVAKAKGSGSTTRTYLAAIRSLCEFHEVSLNWKKLIKASPKYSQSQDRPPFLEEIRQIYEPGDTRLKFAVTLLASSGIRAGAFDYFTLKDLEPDKERGIGVLTVYRGEPEKYTALVSSECLRNFESYLEERRRAGESLTPDSPLIRQPVNVMERKDGIIKTDSQNIEGLFVYHWKRAGFQNREFKCLHGFRKFFKTRLENAGMKTVIVETLMGHATGLNAVYYRPSNEEMMKEYAKFMPALYISEATQAKSQLEQVKQETTQTLKDYKTDLILANQRIAGLEATQARVLSLLEEIKEERLKEKS